jgi:hypothetical protein
LSAAFNPAPDDKHIVVSLETLASGELDTTANTATLVATAINGLAGINAAANGTGGTSLTQPEARKNFFGAGTLLQPTPRVAPGGASTIARVGTLQAGGSPMGSGKGPLNPVTDPYGPPEPMVWSSTLCIANDDTTATNTIEYSFDGVNVHGEVLGGEERKLWWANEAGIAVRLTAGTPTFRITAW